MNFRLALPKESTVLTELAFTAKRHWGYPEAWIELWREELTVTPAFISTHYVEVVEIDNGIVGFVAVTAGASEAEIEHLWVAPNAMGSGIGRELLNHVLEYCRIKGIKELRVVADPHASEFYRKCGAAFIGETASVPTPRKLPVFHFKL